MTYDPPPLFNPRAVKRALIVAMIVGPLLNLINQGDAVLAGAGINYWKGALTFIVPFCVSLGSGYLAGRDRKVDIENAVEAECGQSITLPEPGRASH